MLILDVSKLAGLYTTPLKNMAKFLIKLRGVELPTTVKMGKNITFAHNAYGSVIHSKTVIENDVFIFPGVTIGKADIFENWKNSKVKGFIIEEGAALCSGCKVLCKEGTLTVGRRAIVAANAVLLNSIGPYEIWGVPAKFLGYNMHGLFKDGLSVCDLKKGE